MAVLRTIDLSWISHVIGLLVALVLVSYGWNHRVAAGFMLLLITFGLLLWKPSQLNNTGSISQWRKNLVRVFAAYPLTILAAMLIDSQWMISELDNPARFLLVIPIFLLLSIVDVDRRYVVFGFALGAITIGVASIISLSGDRVSLSYGNPIPMGNIATALGVSAVMSAFLQTNISVSWKCLSAAGLMMGVSASLLSGTKGGWISLLVVALVGLWRWRASISKKMFVVIVVSALLWVFDQSTDRIASSRLVSLEENMRCFIEDPRSVCGLGSVGDRVWMNWVGLQNFIDNPWVGSGLNSTELLLRKAIDSGAIPKIPTYNHLHNDLVELLSSMGLVGLISYLGLYLGLIVTALKFRCSGSVLNPWASMLLVNTVLFMEFGMTQATLSHASTATYFAFTSALLAGLAIHDANQQKEGDVAVREGGLHCK